MKITVIGAGNVGAKVAAMIAERDLANELVLLDTKKGLSEGKSLDLWHTAPIKHYNTRVSGTTNDYERTANSEVIIITSGMARKEGMSRDDLVSINAEIVKSVTENAIKYSPNAKIIVVANPLDVMTYCAYLAAKVDSSRVFGMAGILDSARFRALLAEALDCSPNDIQTLLLGGHGDTMVPLPRYTSVSGIPVNQLIPKDKLNEIIKNTQNAGGEMVKMMGMSAWYAPAAATTQMVAAIVRDQKRIFPCCVKLNGEYGYKDLFIGVPVKLGRNGVEKIIEIELNTEEQTLFDQSAKAVKSAMNQLDKMKLF